MAGTTRTPPVRTALTRPIDVLLAEHALHRRMLTVLERIAAHVERDGSFPASDVARLLGYFREFVETVHHAKEDGTVYPLVMSFADDSLAETVGELIGDHIETKNLLHSLMLFWEPDDLLAEEREVFAELACRYAKRLRRHMEAEEATLFPAAASLDPAADAEILARFAAVSTGRSTLAEWAALAAELEEHWIA